MDESPDPCPKFWDLLTEQDKMSYKYLRQTLASPRCKNRRNRSAKTFNDILEAIKKFVVRGDGRDHDRALVCGVCWLRNSIAINTRQLRLILSKCKSSINGSFQTLGYGTIPNGTESSAELIKYFPEFEGNFNELRQWTVRQLNNQVATPPKLTEIITQTYAPATNLIPTPSTQFPPIVPPQPIHPTSLLSNNEIIIQSKEPTIVTASPRPA
ncbi:hypothetical protein TVAG_383280 [Trichomonas vaginalis G3]|uniref:Initiator binding domain-containing protein n=1 Tax=Trichomonas vaginalis (strain ATCC PRA-98 / G3) TaxID=412133 RepID=A2FSF8_TRIV3|nr:transcription-initiator DNA-binding domain ibd family [Trichomonas vaginalis G3]EAX92155.1 hypothetical protein TVAG_383280 [Trichomonas vaginalis G3]KAI5538933.1 transcription-initiator DNA-binding domain ibd family [Trichomonas vaginalis G3]|eukprot:XP_001305085.1 hypothetical protein [Trichomonas vaginalis G3]